MRIARIFMCVAIAYLTGCSAINSPFNDASNNSKSNNQVNQPVDYQTTDDSPHAISQYMDEIKVAGSGQPEEQVTREKNKRQN